MNTDSHRYDDIIHLSRPLSKHPPLSRTSRAAQFAPFAALKGYDKLVDDSESTSKYLRPDLELDQSEFTVESLD